MYHIDKQKEKIFIEKLFEWHKANYRDFPWRRTNNPYHIIVAEIMLQKTDAKKVEIVFESFLDKYPTPLALSQANTSQLRKDLHLLGIHKRAERLKNLALKIIENYDGEIPKRKEELLSLLGVGDYISNAVLCFAYNQDVPLLDTNVVRILERIFSVKTTKSRARTDKELWKTVENMIPMGSSRAFNLSILDFSAIICKSRNPIHENCPMQKICDYYSAYIDK